MCTHHLNDDPTGLVCDRTDTHDEAAVGGHTYASSAGSHVDDRRPDGGHG